MKLSIVAICTLPFLLRASAQDDLETIETTALGYCFRSTGSVSQDLSSFFCFDVNGTGPFQNDPLDSNFTNDSSNPDRQGNLIGGGLISALDCVCQGGASFHWQGNSSHTYCGLILRFGQLPPAGPDEQLVFWRVSSTYPLANRRKLRKDPRERSLQVSPISFFVSAFFPLCDAGDMDDSGVMGDPHIKKWSGDWYDWHGECDTVFLHAPDFYSGIGLDIHTRTTIRYDYSYIGTAAICIGNDTLEVSGFGEYLYNGVESAELPQRMGNLCGVSHTEKNFGQHLFNVELGASISIHVHTNKDIVSIKIVYGASPVMNDWFGNSSGLMGSFHGGRPLARNGITLLEDPNELGQEWQVLDSEPKLFQDSERSPQFPEKCRLPSKAALQGRRLRGGAVSKAEAEQACSHWNDDEKPNCVADVLASNDLEMANGNGY